MKQMIKKITGFSLFWKIYLTLLAVLFLPIILFTLARIIRIGTGVCRCRAG
jgi:hypothetical protein